MTIGRPIQTMTSATTSTPRSMVTFAEVAHLPVIPETHPQREHDSVNVFKRCSCKNDAGKLLGSACPKRNRTGHGQWGWRIELSNTRRALSSCPVRAGAST
jgi:hypothetical protein